MGFPDTAKFERFVSDWGILQPDIGNADVISLLACAVLCHRSNCTTVGILMMDAAVVCQMSNKKGTCMEKEEAFHLPGNRIYQKKVFTSSYSHVYSSFIQSVSMPSYHQRITIFD
jgi:hypothetical protein